MRVPFFTLFALLLCVRSAAGTRPDALPPLTGYLMTAEQIPSSSSWRFTSAARDDQGFVWFGTPVGLCKYDGYGLRLRPVGAAAGTGYRRGEQDVVRAMIRLRDGTFLLATNRGPWVYNPRTEESAPLRADSLLAAEKITSLAEESSGDVWIGTSSMGLYRLRMADRALRRYTAADGLGNMHITALEAGRSGKLWIGTLDGGLYLRDAGSGRIRPFRGGARLATAHITALSENLGRELWIGTNEGLSCLDLNSGRLRGIDLRSPVGHTVIAMAGDRTGRMWIAVQELGLLTYADGELARFVPGREEERSLNAILCLYLDTAGSTDARLLVWLGTRLGAIRVLVSRSRFTSAVRGQDSLELDRGAVIAICEDSRGTVWTGLWGGGLNGFRRLPDGRYRRIARFAARPGDPRTLPNNDVTSLAEDAGGNLWIGTAGGVAMLDGNRTRIAVFRHRDDDTNSLAHDGVSRIDRDRDGRIWICTRGGLSELVPGPRPAFRNRRAGPDGGSEITAVAQDARGRLWASTYGRGLLRLEADGSWKQFSDPDDPAGREDNWIQDVFAGREGRLWLNTRAGLASFDPSSGAFRRWPIDQLLNVHLFEAFEDSAGELWLSTSLGLARFSPRTGSYVRFGSQDGLPFEELFCGFFRTARGTLLVGGIDGFSEFFPAASGRASPPPRIVLTEFSTPDRALPPASLGAGAIRLAHDENFFALSFAALDYINPARNRFSYRMEGVDREWIDAGTRNYVRYTHLDPGSYVFRVRGCNSDNVWNEEGASLAITIAPPYWQTPWFRLLMVILAGGSAYAAYRYRLRRVIAEERMRLRIADDLHDDVGSNLSAIAMATRALQHAPSLDGATRGRLADIYDTAVATSSGLRDVVWFIKPRNDTLDDLLLRMKDTAAFLLSDLAVDFQAPEPDRSVRLTVDFKRHFYLAFKEILANVVRHAAATRVEVRLQRRNGMLEVTVRDDGRGFEVPDPGSRRRGNGLPSLRNRARSIGGRFEVTSAPGRGTTVRFTGRL